MGYNLKNRPESNSGNDFTSLPADRYTINVEAAEASVSANGNDMVKLTFVVTEGDYKNRKLWHNLVVMDKTLNFVFDFLNGIGSDLINAENVEIEDIVTAALGATCTVYAKPAKTDKGNDTNKLSSFAPVKETEASPFN